MSLAARRYLAAAALLIGNLLLHKPLSDVCDAAYARLGRSAYEWLSLGAIGALCLAGAIILLRGGAARLRQPRPVLALLALAALSVAAQRTLLVSNVELVHLPQFALLAVLLLAAGLPAVAAWLVATLGGALDELYQRLVIYPAVPNVYFDWNDIVLNAIGAAWAVVLVCGGRGTAPAAWSAGRRRAALAAALAGVALAGWLAPPNVALGGAFPFVTPVLRGAMTGRLYHVMPASEGLLALVVLWLLVALAVRAPAARGRLP